MQTQQQIEVDEHSPFDQRPISEKDTANFVNNLTEELFEQNFAGCVSTGKEQQALKVLKALSNIKLEIVTSAIQSTLVKHADTFEKAINAYLDNTNLKNYEKIEF